MSHPFGDLLTQHLHRKHGLSQSKLAAGILQSPSIVTEMCQGKRLNGPQARDRVVAIIGWLHQQGALVALDDANALLSAAGMSALRERDATEAALMQPLNQPLSGHTRYAPLHPTQTTPRLPIAPTPLLGRDQDLATIKRQLLHPDVRLLSLLGSPGVGKTRLALQVALDMRGAFKDGVWPVSLAPVSNAELVISTIVQTLGLRQASNQPDIDIAKQFLHDRCALLVLDNFEQVLGAAPVVAELLAAAPRLKVLVTSRAALRISAEHEFQVPPLALPDLNHLPQLEALSAYAALALFIQRAQAVLPQFALTQVNAAAIAGICWRLDGLPLAIELAAARLKLFSPHMLLARLSGDSAQAQPGTASSLQMLTGGASDLPLRQRTLRNTIDWSYNLLDAYEQAIFRRLGVFVGGFTLEAAQGVAGAEWPVINSLLDKSMIQHRLDAIDALDDARGNEARFTLLETLREYALEVLVERGEIGELRRQHAAYYLELAETAEPHFFCDQQIQWLTRLRREHDNIRTVLRWAQDQGDVQASLRLLGALWRYWQTGRLVGEGRAWLSQALAHSSLFLPTVPDLIQAKACHAAGSLAFYQSDVAEAVRLHEQGVRLAGETRDERIIGMTFSGYALGVASAEDFARAKLLLEKVFAFASENKQSWAYAASLHILAVIAVWRPAEHDYERAVSLANQSKTILLRLGDKIWAMSPLLTLGEATRLIGDYAQAEKCYLQGLTLAKELGEDFSEYLFVCKNLSGLAALAVGQKRPLRMATLQGAVDGLHERAGIFHVSNTGKTAHSTAIDDYAAATGETIDERTFVAAWNEGYAMTFEQIVDYAL